MLLSEYLVFSWQFSACWCNANGHFAFVIVKGSRCLFLIHNQCIQVCPWSHPLNCCDGRIGGGGGPNICFFSYWGKNAVADNRIQTLCFLDLYHFVKCSVTGIVDVRFEQNKDRGHTLVNTWKISVLYCYVLHLCFWMGVGMGGGGGMGGRGDEPCISSYSQLN